MKTMNFLITSLCVIFLLTACNGKSKAEKAESEEVDSTEIVRAKYEGDPYVEVIKSYSKEDLLNLIGKDKVESVKDFFMLLPMGDVLTDADEATYTADRQKLLEGETINELKVNPNNLSDEYLQIIGAFEGLYEIRAYKSLDGTLGLLLNFHTCGPICANELTKSYFIEGNTLILYSGASIAGLQDIWLDMFVDTTKLSDEVREEAERVLQEQIPTGILYKLPESGEEDIEVYVNDQYFYEVGVPEDAIKTFITKLPVD